MDVTLQLQIQQKRKKNNGLFISIVNPRVKFQEPISNGPWTSASVTLAQMDR